LQHTTDTPQIHCESVS